MDSFRLPSGEGFEDYSLRTFECFLSGVLFPYSLRETYTLVYASWREAVKELTENGAEGFSYIKSPDGDDYLMCMQGFTQHIVMQDKSLTLLPIFCNTTYKQMMTIFDIPVHYETRSERGADGKMRIIQVPVNGYQPKAADPMHCGFMEASGDLMAKMAFDRFQKETGFTKSTEEIAEAFGMPEEGLLCILKQNGMIEETDEEDGWELAENYQGLGLTLVKTGKDGMPEKQWTYEGGYYIWLLLTKDCGIRPCCERDFNDHE